MAEIIEHPEWVVINEALDTLDQMREQFIDLIHGMVAEGEIIDFTDDSVFYASCDRAFVGVYNDRIDVVHQVNHEYVITSDEYDKNLEDMTAQELLQVYRCLCEYDEWKQTGKISYK